MLSYRLRHRVTFQRRIPGVQDQETGEIPMTWAIVELPDGSPLENVPAEVLTGSGKELIAAAAPQIETTARVNLRWFPVDRLELCRWRIAWDGRLYNIVSAETDATARREWRLRCEDGLTDGQ